MTKYYLGLNSETNFNFDLLKQFSGVGMIRGENLCISKMQYFTTPEFCEYVKNYLIYVSNVFDNKDVWYRTADLVAHQVNLLDGCDKEMVDTQYLIGLRAIRRNLLLKETYLKELKTFNEAFKKNNNLGLLIPFVSNLDEINEVKKITSDIGYNGRLGVMIEIPSLIFMLDELNKLGIDNFTVGVNDLTTTLLGANRSLDIYSINNPAVYKAIETIVKKVHSFGKEITLAGYLNKEMKKFAEDIGVDIINVHYNEIPLMFDNQDEEFFTSHYKNIKENYKVKKKAMNINE